MYRQLVDLTTHRTSKLSTLNKHDQYGKAPTKLTSMWVIHVRYGVQTRTNTLATRKICYQKTTALSGAQKTQASVYCICTCAVHVYV